MDSAACDSGFQKIDVWPVLFSTPDEPVNR